MMNENDTLSQHYPTSPDVERTDVAVIGGGLTGLAAAIYAARGGRTVTLFEKASEVGGLARTNEKQGFFMNRGAHALYFQQEAGEVLRELGVAYSGKEPPQPLFALANDTLHELPLTSLALLRTTLFDTGAKLEMARLLAGVQRADLHVLEQVSLQEWLEQQVRHPRLRAFLLMLACVTTYTNAPEMLSAALYVDIVRKTPKVLYLDGGWQTLVDGLRRVAQSVGVRIRTGTRVSGIEHGGHVQGVRLARGEFLPAGAVIVAAGPQEASKLVDGGKHPTLERWSREAVPSPVACLDVALRSLPDPRHLGVFSMERPLYLVVHSASARLAPAGGALIHTIQYQKPGEDADPRAVEAELEALLDRVQPGWREEVVERQFLPDMHATNAIVQARYGGLSGRPGPQVPGIDNLYVAGDWVGPAGQLTSASLASARSAARLACEQTPSIVAIHREYEQSKA